MDCQEPRCLHHWGVCLNQLMVTAFSDKQRCEEMWSGQELIDQIFVIQGNGECLFLYSFCVKLDRTINLYCFC